MVIQHNIAAQNAWRNLGKNRSSSAKSLEKLASGYRLNRAADDASGLAVSEKMRLSITGLGRAQENVNEGIDLVKIAEGGMQEIHDMLNRMFSLAEQSMNGVYEDAIDREGLDAEYQALRTEIDRIADSTAYGDIKLLDGSNRKPTAAKPKVTMFLKSGKGLDAPAAQDSRQVSPAGSVLAINQFASVVGVASQKSEQAVENLKKKAEQQNHTLDAVQQASFAAATKSSTPRNAVQAGSFTVEGDSNHFSYDSTTKTLLITGDGVKISGGDGTDRIKIDDGITGEITLTLDKVDASKITSGCALDLGIGNTVTLELANDSKNLFTSGSGYAGVAVGAGTNLKIHSENPAAELIAEGGQGGAGIGRNKGTLTDPQDMSSKIEISGCKVTSTGGVGGAGIGGGDDSAIGAILIENANVTATSVAHGAGIGGGWCANNGDITIKNSTVQSTSTQHGTGIGAGCRGTSGDITIEENSTVTTKGGDDGAGIGASWRGKCGDITIRNSTTVTATGGDNGAGIGSGSDESNCGKITIDGGTVKANGGKNGVGIGSGCSGSTCGDIQILSGTVSAKGSTDATGIGAGRNSTSADITIGSDSNKPVIVTAIGGMTNNGGNILTYTDQAHKNEGELKILGTQTSVRAGAWGEVASSTTKAKDENGNTLYAYPLYLFDQKHNDTDILDKGPVPYVEEPYGAVGANLENHLKNLIPSPTFLLPLRDDLQIAKTITISATSENGSTKTWEPGLNHGALENGDYAFLWMTGENQTITVGYTDASNQKQTIKFNLEFYPEPGIFRAGRVTTHSVPPPAYSTEISGPPISGGDSTKPVPDLDIPSFPNPPEGEEDSSEHGGGGLILQIGETGNEFDRLHVYIEDMHTSAMGLTGTNVRTQSNATVALDACRKAINYVSAARGDMGAYQNRLEHTFQMLDISRENTTDAESVIRDADMATEIISFTKSNILIHSAQAMLAQANQQPQAVLSMINT